MSSHHGNEGSVAVGANTVAEVLDWSYDEQDTGLLPSLPLGASAETYKASGAKRGSGTINVQFDETDTTGQGALTVGSAVTLNLYVEGTSSGDTYFTGTVNIESRGAKLAQGSITTQSFSYKGVLTEGEVAA